MCDQCHIFHHQFVRCYERGDRICRKASKLAGNKLYSDLSDDKYEDKETEETMETNATEENTAENIPELTTIQKKIDEDGETEIQNEKNNENETAGEDIIHTVS